jgi:hypothetical protein
MSGVASSLADLTFGSDRRRARAEDDRRVRHHARRSPSRCSRSAILDESLRQLTALARDGG